MAQKSKILKSARPAKFRVRQRNRCSQCGRPRAYFRRYGLCRICLRSLASRGLLPGVTKASW
jgi:small subunit ribosomal protein S14